MERQQPIVLGINEKGEMIWGNIEMPLWQRKMFPIHYCGDFMAFWEKLEKLQAQGREIDSPNFAGFKSYVYGSNGEKIMAKNKRKHHKGGLITVNKIVALILLGFLTSACSKKEDAPPPRTPHVSGQWDGTGTDNTIGWYQISVNLTQAGDTAAGTYQTLSSFGTTKGRIIVNLKAGGGLNLTSVSMTRETFTGSVKCAGSLSLARDSSMTDSNVSFLYKVTDCDYTNEDGGLNMTKTVGLN